MDVQEVDQLDWFVAWVHWRAEIRARSGLEQKGYEVLVPTHHVNVRHAGRTMLVERPMFPRYLFVGVRNDQSWYPILSSTCISGLITNHQKPVKIPTWIMRNLVQAQNTDAFSRKVEILPGKPGDKVKFEGGAFEGFVGTIQRALPGRRVSVLIEMLGHKQQFSVPVAQLAAA